MTRRALLLAFFLIPLNSWWVLQAEVIWTSVHATVLSLFFNAVTTLFLLSLINLLFSKLSPRLALTRAELLTVYLMICLSTSLGSHDMLEILLSLMGHPFYFATPENEWKELFFRYLPRWLMVSDEKALEGYYEGGTSLYRIEHLKAWLPPVGFWLSFIAILLLSFLCLDLIIMRRWTEEERLAFPITQLPLEMSEPGFFRNKLMWIGFACAASLELMRDLHSLFPAIPSPRLGYNLAPLLTSKPWNAIRWMPIHFYPFVLGLSYFMPLDLSFSVWFFYLFWKAQLVVRSALGMRPPSGFYLGDQSCGAWLGIGFLALFGLRKHMLRAFKDHRGALLGFLFSLAFMITFLNRAGISSWVALSFLGFYFIIALAVTRMRAELGPPTHDLYYAGPDRILVSALGTRRFSPSDLAVFSLLYWLTRDYRSHPMPHQLEGLRIARKTGMDEVKLGFSMIFAGIFGSMCFIWAALHEFYRTGMHYIQFLGSESFWRLHNWLSFPRGPDSGFLREMTFGLIFTTFLGLMRRRFLWFAFHPVGYAVSGSWTMSWMWFSILIGYVLKRAILRYGGLRLFRKLAPFFLGLILGQYVVGSLWTLVGIAFRTPVHSFFV